jgi:hypothetical protein
VGELTAVARLYETGLKRRYRRASVLPGRGEPLCLLSDANDAIRELTRQVEQLQARVDAAEKDVRRYQWLREHVKPWEGFDAGYPYCEIDIYLRELANGSVEKVSIIGPRDAVGMASLDTAVDIALSALTAPPSSSDPGRNDSKGIEGDTGREER